MRGSPTFPAKDEYFKSLRAIARHLFEAGMRPHKNGGRLLSLFPGFILSDPPTVLLHGIASLLERGRSLLDDEGRRRRIIEAASVSYIRGPGRLPSFMAQKYGNKKTPISCDGAQFVPMSRMGDFFSRMLFLSWRKSLLNPFSLPSSRLAEGAAQGTFCLSGKRD